LDSPVVECLVSQIKPKYKTFTDYFSLVSPDFHPLLRGLLKFNPHQRLTAKDAFNLDLFKEFFEEENNDYSIKAIVPQLNDNKRYNLRDYRNKIYSNIPKKLRAPSEHKEVHHSGLFKNESIKRINKKKVMSKTLEVVVKK
jgi:serine/threonine protein kinase